MLGGEATSSTWNFGSTGLRWSKIAEFQPIFARSSSAVTPSEKVQITRIGSPLCAFQRAYDDRRTLPLSLPKGVSKTQNGRFPCKITLRFKKVCYKVSLCEHCQRQSCKSFIGLTSRAKMNGGGDPFYLKFWISEIAVFRSLLAGSDSAVTPSKKVQLTLIGSPLRAFHWAQDEHRTLSLSPTKDGSKTQCPKFEHAAITQKRYEIECHLLLIINRKSHTGFRLVPTSMTLNAVITLILRFFHRIRHIFRPIISQWLKTDL